MSGPEVALVVDSLARPALCHSKGRASRAPDQQTIGARFIGIADFIYRYFRKWISVPRVATKRPFPVGLRPLLRRPETWITDQHRCRGFTLFELLLVLVLLAMLATASLPAVFSTLRGQRLKASAEKVLTEFNRARVDAMETGRIRMFRFQQETGNFTIAPFIRGSDELENNLAGTSSGMGISSVVYESAEQETVRGTLEEGIVFAGDDVQIDMRSYSLEQEGGQLDLAGWSRPVLFYPDGTTSDATIYLRSESGSLTSVRLRGLTGIARITEPNLNQEGD